jgi:hypothetical protein
MQEALGETGRFHMYCLSQGVMLRSDLLQVRKRLVVAPPSYVIKVVDKDGIRTVKTIRTALSGGQAA